MPKAPFMSLAEAQEAHADVLARLDKLERLEQRLQALENQALENQAPKPAGRKRK